jgi:DNA-binding LytR/AlgR family response regulator
MKFSCIIIDDEPPSHQVLKSHLKLFPNIDLAGNFFNAKDASEFLSGHSIDILLLDIQMPEISGLSLLRSLEARPVTIITTAFRDYALEGFELGVIDYLLKPIDVNRFASAMNRAVDFLQLAKSGDTLDTSKMNTEFMMLIKSGTKRIVLDYRKIMFAQGLKDYTILHTADKKYVVKGSIKVLEEFLPDHSFMRVHKSFIVAKPLIQVVQKNKIELENISIPIGRSFKENVDRLLNNYL